MNTPSSRHSASLSAIAARFPQLREERLAWCQKPAGIAGAPVLIAEFHGSRVDDVRELRAGVIQALKEAGAPAQVELVRADWLPLTPDGNVNTEALPGRYESLVAQRKQTVIEDGSFAVLPDPIKDSFAYFGTQAKIRTPAEITHPNHITLGNWVSLGRYGKIVMLPEEAFGASCGKLARQHYPEIADTFDFTGWEKDRPANLYLGDGTTLGDRYFIICTQSVEFGKHVMTAANLFVSDCHHIYEDTEIPPVLLPPTKGRPVKIEDHVWIGINCCILEGVTIGRHAVVAANSVVKDDVPPYTLVAGSPARVKKEFKPKP